jgi:rhodanese-related sulfurtransferase
MKAYIVTLTIIDLDEIGAEEIKDVIESAHYPNRCISPDVVNIESADIGEWSDEHLLNDNRTAEAEWRRLFPSLKK